MGIDPSIVGTGSGSKVKDGKKIEVTQDKFV